MEKRVLIISTNEGFIIKGLETKLNGIGVLSLYSPPITKEIKEKCDNTDLIIIFTDENLGMGAEAFRYVKDYCSGKNEDIIVVGTKDEYEKLEEYIPQGLVFKFYERPLDMEELLDDIENYMREESKLERRKSILIVDDDVSYMSVISNWLKDSYRISMANSGMQAITWLAKNKADLILLDYEMPITTGPQVLEMIRSDVSMADIPVMFLTGKSDKDSIMKVLSLKPVGYLLKTVERKELRNTIAHYFAAKKA